MSSIFWKNGFVSTRDGLTLNCFAFEWFSTIDRSR